MATPTVKSTYSLDIDTIQRLDAIARRWNVSKTEALRRAIQAAEKQSPEKSDALKALDQLQSSLALTENAALRWEKHVRSERRASNRVLESREK